MPNVLIIGATGNLGSAIGQAFLRSGNYTVFGTTRQAAKSKTLITNEITPLVGTGSDPTFLTAAIADNRIDIVVDSAQSSPAESASILSAVIQAAKDRTAKLAPVASAKLGFIYTSGIFVHGNSGSTRVSDLIPAATALSPSTPPAMVAWRPGHEDNILKARDVLEVAIIRPGLLYGRGGSTTGVYWGPLFGAAAAEEVHIPATEEARTSVVHIDDVAESFKLAADKLHGGLGSWPVFDVTAETVTVPDIVHAAAKALEIPKEKKIIFAGTFGNPFLEAMSLVHCLESSRARSVLGWAPKRRDFLLNIGVWVKASAAAQEDKKE